MTYFQSLPLQKTIHIPILRCLYEYRTLQLSVPLLYHWPYFASCSKNLLFQIEVYETDK